MAAVLRHSRLISLPYSQDPFSLGGYELVSGVLYAINGTQVSVVGPGFRQFGGTNYGDITATGVLSSTNVAGPYLPVPGASSPWTNFFNAPHRFFRLQSSP